jgi:hypothetical protein
MPEVVERAHLVVASGRLAVTSLGIVISQGRYEGGKSNAHHEARGLTHDVRIS